MLITLFQWILLLLLAYLAVVLTLHIFEYRGKHSQKSAISIPARLLLGLGLLGAWAVLLSIFMPLGAIAILITGLVLGISTVIHRQVVLTSLRADWAEMRRTHPLILLAGLALAFICLFWSVQVPENYDTGLYHAQAIRWLEEYGTVTGLGNLIPQLGYNPLLFPLAALSSFSFLGVGSSHAMNGLLFAVFGIFLLGKLAGLFKGRMDVGILGAFILLYLSRRIYIRELSSPSTDLPAGIFTWLAVFLFLDVLLYEEDVQPASRVIPIGLSALFAVMFKLSALPVILLPLYLFFTLSRKQDLGRLALLALTILVPWEIRGLLLSGLPLYPSKMLDIFNFKWEIPQVNVDSQLLWMRYIDRTENRDPLKNQALALEQWIPDWWQRLGLFDQVLVVGAVATAIGLLIYGISKVIKKETRGKKSGILALAITLLFSLVFWFIGSPMIRYGYNVIIILFSVGLASVFVVLLKPGIKFLPYLAYVLVSVILVYQLYGVYKITRSDILAQYIVQPADYPESELVVMSMGDFEVTMPVGEFNYDWCWYAPLPCTPVHDPWVNLLGEGLGDGFYNSAP
jgi:hypothetical protein